MEHQIGANWWKGSGLICNRQTCKLLCGVSHQWKEVIARISGENERGQEWSAYMHELLHFLSTISGSFFVYPKYNKLVHFHHDSSMKPTQWGYPLPVNFLSRFLKPKPQGHPLLAGNTNAWRSWPAVPLTLIMHNCLKYRLKNHLLPGCPWIVAAFEVSSSS